MSNQAVPEPSHFYDLFESALQEWEQQTGTPLAKHPLAEQLEQCNSVQSVSDVLQEQARPFSRSQGRDSKIVKFLNSAISVLHTLSTNTDLRDAISAPFPPAKLIFIAFAVLLSAARDVSASYDMLASLFKRIKQFLNRLEIYTQVPLSPAMVEFIITTVVQLLHVLGLVTKEIKRTLLIKVGRKIFGENDIKVALQKLDEFTLLEGPTITAQVLQHADGLVRDMREVKDNGKASHKLLQRIIACDLNTSKRDKLTDIRSWLSPPDPWKNHNEVCKLRHPKTAAWFVQDRPFLDWKTSGPGSLLWIHGKSGAGKSVLCSTIIQEIHAARRSGLASLAFYYCDFREEQKKDLHGLLSSILVQLCHQSDAYCDTLSKFYEDHDMGLQHPSDGALVGCLKDILNLPEHPPVYLIVDALDECPNPPVRLPPRQEVLMLVKDLIDSKLPNLRICVTSRPETDISVVLKPLASHSVSLHDEGRQKDDIDNYIKSVVTTDQGMQRWKEEDRQLVIDTLTKKAGGMFRWVDCQVAYLRNCPLSRIQQILDDLPMTLEETYERTLREINVAKRELAQSLFRCVAVASRPLRVKELTDLLAFDFKAGPSPKFREDWREEDPVNAVLSTCSSFLAVVEVEDVQVIQFSHFSVKEFLTSDRLSKANDTITNYHVSMTPAHTLIAQACLGILLHLPKDVTRNSLQKYPLVEYAAEHWIDHARFKGVSSHVELGIKYLFDPSKSHLEVWVWIHDPEMLSQAQTQRAETPPPLRGTPLHYAAICGLHAVAESLVTEYAQDVHSQGFNDKSTPMHAAASRGHAEVIRVLLKHGAVATAKTNNGWTPLHRAADGGHAEVARVLLEHDRAIAAAKAKNGRTPLHVASDRGLVEVARVLLKYGADATAKDRSERTPLHAASLEGHAELARLLLEHGAVATAQDKKERTPLHEASDRGHVEVVRVLLEHIKVTQPLEHCTVQKARNGKWRTPLHGASAGGHAEVARLLLGHGADANAQDRKGRTPLHEAASLGHVEVARLLIEHGVDATVQDNKGWTPLRWASTKGHVELAQLLGNSAGATAQE